MRLVSCLAKALLAATFILIAMTQRAYSQIGVYGEFSASDFNLPNTDWQYGTTFGLYYNRWSVPFFSFGLDGRGSVVGSGSTKIDSGLAGARLTFKPHVLPVMPYAEALVGAAHVVYGPLTEQTSATKLEYQFLGGADLTVLPRVDWRVIEFSYGRVSGKSLNPSTLSTGIVLRLP